VKEEQYYNGVHSAPYDTSWNGQWADFFNKNPAAKAKDMKAFRDKLGNDFKINQFLGGI
jgi:hypothetical protein